VSDFYSFAAWALVGVVAFIATTFLVSSREQWFMLCATWTVIGTAVLVWAYGTGFYWSPGSFVGKLAANVVAVVTIVVAASVGVWPSRSNTRTPVWRIVGGLLGGVLGIALSQITGLIAACSFTGDCL
jgi:energy-coupling factor transporter transmembrane protein EcfT